MNLCQVLILLSICSSTIVAVIAIPFFNKHSSSASTSSSPTTHSSLLLQHHRTIYTNRRPHDTSLYDILNVKSNATLAEMQKSWRRKSLQWHPDKVALRRRQKERGSDNGLNNDERGRDVHNVVVVPPPPPPPPGSDDQRIIKGQDGQNNNNDIDSNKQNEHDKDEEYARNQLQKIQHAYEILSDDHNRLLYHKYGLIGGTDAAVQLLTGRATSASASAAGGGVSGGGIMNDGGATAIEQIRLLELMGYHHTHQNQHQYPSSSASHQQRIHTLTTTITEYLRPLVEGTISQDNFVSQIHSEMNTLKKSPLGAQILRCVGRAYKVEGWRVLRQMREEKYRQRYGRSYSQNRHRHHSSSSRKRNGQNNSRVDDILQDSWRSTKHYASAAYASGKLVLMEQKLKKLEEDQLRQKEERRRKKRMREEEDRLKRIQGCSDESNHHVFSSNIGSLSDDEDEEFDIDSFSDIDLDNNNDSDSDMMMFSASESEDSDDDNDEIEYELQHIQNQKAYTALLSMHQMEALWKVTKIELDRTVREACRWILAPTPSSVPAIAGGGGGRSEGGGWYAFCPSEQSPYQEDWQHYQASPPPPPPPPPPPSSHHGEHHYQQRHHQHRRRLRQQWQHQQQQRRPRQHSKADGWVGLNGQVVPMEVGRLRAAAAMVLVGDIMVRCSKEGTAWKKNK